MLEISSLNPIFNEFQGPSYGFKAENDEQSNDKNDRNSMHQPIKIAPFILIMPHSLTCCREESDPPTIHVKNCVMLLDKRFSKNDSTVSGQSDIHCAVKSVVFHSQIDVFSAVLKQCKSV